MDLPDDEPDRLSNRTFQYDPAQDKWTEGAPMKYSKYRFSTAVVNSEIYVLGKRKQIFSGWHHDFFFFLAICLCKVKYLTLCYVP